MDTRVGTRAACLWLVLGRAVKTLRYFSKLRLEANVKQSDVSAAAAGTLLRHHGIRAGPLDFRISFLRGRMPIILFRIHLGINQNRQRLETAPRTAPRLFFVWLCQFRTRSTNGPWIYPNLQTITGLWRIINSLVGVISSKHEFPTSIARRSVGRH